jgi:hypothetical protein
LRGRPVDLLQCAGVHLLLMIAASASETWNNWAGAVESFATTIGLGVAAVWAYFKFIKDRVYRPRFDVSLSAEVVQVLGQRHLLCSANVKNIGTSKIAIYQHGTGLRVSTSADSHVGERWTWQGTFPILEEHEWIESGERVRDDVAITLPREPSLVMLEMWLVCPLRWGDDVVVFGRAIEAPNRDGAKGGRVDDLSKEGK